MTIFFGLVLLNEIIETESVSVVFFSALSESICLTRYLTTINHRRFFLFYHLLLLVSVNNEVFHRKWPFFLSFFKCFGGLMSFFGATGTPVLVFW